MTTTKPRWPCDCAPSGDELGPNPLSDAQQRIVNLVATKKAELVRTSVTDLEAWQTSLRSLAHQLEDLAGRAAHAAQADLADE